MASMSSRCRGSDSNRNQFTELGRDDASGAPIEQLDRERGLQHLDALGERGLADPQRCRRLTKAAVLGKRDDLAQTRQCDLDCLRLSIDAWRLQLGYRPDRQGSADVPPHCGTVLHLNNRRKVQR